jgi:hypothetical protein
VQKKYSLYLYLSYLLLLHSILFGHGFGANTLVRLASGSQKNIYTLCLHALHNKHSIISYDVRNRTIINQQVKIGKRSKSNCYIRLGFDNNFQDPHDIICTPSQEFYSLTRKAWVPAYLLQIGDALLTKDMTAKQITYNEFIPKAIKIYMLEIEKTHTFFVGKYSLLTHNIFLPVTASIGFVIPFGSVIAGSAGSFFGPIGIVGGLAFGSLISVIGKILYETRINRYQTPAFDISFIENSCNKTINYNENIGAKPAGCFTDSPSIEIPCAYPIENPSPHISTGCFEIEIHPLDNYSKNSCNKNDAKAITSNNGCFPQSETNEQLSFYSQEKNSEKKKDVYVAKEQYNGPWYNRTEDWIDEHPFGQKIKKSLERSKYTNQGKRAFKVIENIDNCDGFKKGDYIVVDAMHKDHLEVFDKNEKWKSVSNFDGTRNEEKTKQGMKESRRPLER